MEPRFTASLGINSACTQRKSENSSSMPANNLLERTGDAAPEARDNRDAGSWRACEGPIPGRSLVPAAQAQAARSRYANPKNHMINLGHHCHEIDVPPDYVPTFMLVPLLETGKVER